MRAPRWTHSLPVAAVLAGLLGAAFWSIRAGWADLLLRRETVAATAQAIAVTPDQSEGYARLAWLESLHDSRRAKAALLRALELNSWDTRSRVELGLLAEAEGDDATAERYLLHSAQLDHLFLPRWTLANYYFRRGDTPRFWHWAREAAPMVYGDALPVFRLCGRVVEDGNLIDRLQIQNPDLRAGYLSYLLGLNRLDLIGPALDRVLERNRDADAPLLKQACERLLGARRVDQAAALWNRQAALGRVKFHTPLEEGEQLVTNQSFAEPPASWGFDWRLPVVEGVGFSREDESGGLRITFSGRQPEDCEALAQLVPPGKHTRYQMKFDYRTQGVGRTAGLAWRITDAGRDNGAVIAESPIALSDTDATGILKFETPADCRLLRVAVICRRVPGTTRLEGFLVFRNVALKPGP